MTEVSGALMEAVYRELEESGIVTLPAAMWGEGMGKGRVRWSPEKPEVFYEAVSIDICGVTYHLDPPARHALTVALRKDAPPLDNTPPPIRHAEHVWEGWYR